MKIKIFKLKKHKLEKDHLNFYKDNGYLVLRGVFKKKEVNYLNKKISFFSDEGWHNIMNPDRKEFLIAQTLSKIGKIKNLQDKIKFLKKAEETSIIYREYLKDKRVKKLLERITKNKMVGLMTHVIFKHARSKYSKLSWAPHQDNSYAKMKGHSYITTNLFIHKSNKKNGCLYLFPGSHKKGLLKFKKYFSYHANENQKPGNRTKLNTNNFKKIDLKINSGDYLIMNGNLVHGSYPNLSKKYSRHLISFNYGIKGKKFFSGDTAQRRSIQL